MVVTAYNIVKRFVTTESILPEKRKSDQSATKKLPDNIIDYVKYYKTTLDADYSKSQEALLGVLGHMMSGKSFELILAAAAATGKLKKFAAKLIKFNEVAKQTSGEGSKASYTRALLYDISFLMLCHIAQLYGVEMVTANGGDSFFENWATHCLPDDNGPKPLEMALKPEQSKKMVDNVRSRMCCIPVCIGAWLCSYINILGAAEKSRPIQLLQMFMVPLGGEPAMQFYNERNLLMTNIIKKMCSNCLDSWPSGTSSSLDSTFTIPLTTPTSIVAKDVFAKVLEAGCVDKTVLAAMDQIINVSGVQWFCEKMVNHLLSLQRKDELQSAVEIMIALFQVDIEQLTLALIRTVLTQILNDPSQWQRLSDPQGHALATFSVWCVASAQMSQDSYREVRSKENSFKPLRGRKRGFVDRDEGGFKLRRVLSTADQDSTTTLA
uniref:Mediator of RNA polymerase II transcription subunit 24 n=1 Tax=Saccoglossus kowalevskii TaxID=10224 RepID=A0ABM0MC93_SACKO